LTIQLPWRRSTWALRLDLPRKQAAFPASKGFLHSPRDGLGRACDHRAIYSRLRGGKANPDTSD